MQGFIETVKGQWILHIPYQQILKFHKFFQTFQ